MVFREQRQDIRGLARIDLKHERHTPSSHTKAVSQPFHELKPGGSSPQREVRLVADIGPNFRHHLVRKIGEVGDDQIGTLGQRLGQIALKEQNSVGDPVSRRVPCGDGQGACADVHPVDPSGRQLEGKSYC
jgi:hypothetical protein